VKSGPISSGGFVGYLMNIFLQSNVHIYFVGEAKEGEQRRYDFRYEVPLESSHYQAHIRGGLRVIPFHGTFRADAESYQLLRLTVIGDAFPKDADMCFAETQVTYTDRLIPAEFLLRIANLNPNLYTESAGKYEACKEFRGESALVIGDATAGPERQRRTRANVAAGKTLRIRLTTPIDERRSFTGDPVEGVLADAVALDEAGTTVPQNSPVRGVITELTAHYVPSLHYYLKIEFERLTAGDREYSLRALHRPNGKEADKLYFLFGEQLPENVKHELETGTMIFDSRHARLERGFTSEWRTANERRADELR
jgi:hypothetical protein